jgi:hypothetical protein
VKGVVVVVFCVVTVDEVALLVSLSLFAKKLSFGFSTFGGAMGCFLIAVVAVIVGFAFIGVSVIAFTLVVVGGLTVVLGLTDIGIAVVAGLEVTGCFTLAAVVLGDVADFTVVGFGFEFPNKESKKEGVSDFLVVPTFEAVA